MEKVHLNSFSAAKGLRNDFCSSTFAHECFSPSPPEKKTHTFFSGPMAFEMMGFSLNVRDVFCYISGDESNLFIFYFIYYFFFFWGGEVRVFKCSGTLGKGKLDST